MMRKDVVYASVRSGLGNQLFQYAAGRSLADRLGCELILDTRWFAEPRRLSPSGGKEAERQFLLDHFIHARYLRDVDLPTSKTENYLKYKFEKIFRRLSTFRDTKPGTYNPTFPHQPKGTYLHGYWQSSQYFLPIEKQLRQDLIFTPPRNEASAIVARQIKEANNSVGLHIRRGDYVNSHWDICQPAYYYSALEYIEDNIKAPLTCFIFSNDPEWARSNIQPKHKTVFVDVNDEAGAYDDLLLQSLCDHNIIANSSFSWWAAWLNSNSHKIVIAPSEWFKTNELSSRDIFRDIYPDGWIKMP